MSVHQPAGWADPFQGVRANVKFHYWAENEARSLCSKYHRWGLPAEAFEDTNDTHSQNCKACMKKKLALMQENGVTKGVR